MKNARVGDEEQDDRRTIPRLTLARLFKGKTPEEWRKAYADAFDWGPDVGREIIEE